VNGEILAALFILAGTIGIVGVASIIGDRRSSHPKKESKVKK
jgi:hypothetical protein